MLCVCLKGISGFTCMWLTYCQILRFEVKFNWLYSFCSKCYTIGLLTNQNVGSSWVIFWLNFKFIIVSIWNICGNWYYLHQWKFLCYFSIKLPFHSGRTDGFLVEHIPSLSIKIWQNNMLTRIVLLIFTEKN